MKAASRTQGHKLIKRWIAALPLLLTLVILLDSGCVYFNTFYHARKFFNEAEKSRKKANRDKAETEKGSYENAIKKCSKVLAEYPGSKYEDDALFIIGKSFYYIGDFPKAERKFRELLSMHPNSEYAEESRFFLGKTRYRLENYLLALEVFADFIKSSKDAEKRTEAIFLSGKIHEQQENFPEAAAFYKQLYAEYKSDPRVPEALYQVAEIYYKDKQFDSALTYYRLAAEKAPDLPRPASIGAASTEIVSRYKASLGAGRSLYALDSVGGGMELFRESEARETDSTRLAQIRLRIAEGECLSGNVEQAIRLYDAITSDFSKKGEIAEAYYQMGVIIQDYFQDLELAKDMFDWGSRVSLGGDFQKSSMERSAEIAKVEEYQRDLSSDELENAVKSQFLLAELYRLSLNRPDSAFHEYQSLVEDYPGSELAPQSLLAIGWLYENHYHDTAAALQSYHRLLNEYPYSDQCGEALELLKADSAYSDIVYPEKLYASAEEQYLQHRNLDSAVTLFKKVTSQFPDSRFAPRAEFASAKIMLEKFVPEESPDDSTFVDSTMIRLFEKLAEKYPGTIYAEEATKLIKGIPATVSKKQRPAQDTSSQTIDTSKVLGSQKPQITTDTLSELQALEQKVKAEIDKWPLAPEKPSLEGTFEYPINAYGSNFEGKLATKIKISFDGKVTEVEMLKGSNNVDIDREVTEALLHTEFNVMEIDPLQMRGEYFIYYFEVKLPEVLKNR